MIGKKYVGFMLVLVLAVMFLSSCGSSSPVDVLGGVQQPRNTIQVVGVGQAKGTPDIASIQMGINLVDSNLEAVIETGNQSIEMVTDALVAAGIERRDIRTTNYGIWPEDVYDRLTGEQTGERRYHADLTLEVTIRDIERMGEFIQVGLDAGVNNIYGINFGLDERTQLETEARAAAIVEAQMRAEELASGLGLNVGEPLSISEGVLGTPVGVGFAADGLGGGGGAPISPGQSTVSVQVTVVFELVE